MSKLSLVLILSLMSLGVNAQNNKLINIDVNFILLFLLIFFGETHSKENLVSRKLNLKFSIGSPLNIYNHQTITDGFVIRNPELYFMTGLTLTRPVKHLSM